MKNIITLTPAAEQHINEILLHSNEKVFLVSIDNKGCSGHSYAYETCDENLLNKFDEKILLREGIMAIKYSSVFKLLGSTLDVNSNIMGTQLVWSNPQVVNTCGCGKSVSF